MFIKVILLIRIWVIMDDCQSNDHPITFDDWPKIIINAKDIYF